MFISEKHKIVFLAIPKTGTRSIYELLKNNFDGYLVQDHLTQIPLQFKDWYIFTIVRNPYDRACSIYWAVNKREGPSHGFDILFEKYNMENNLVNYLKCVKMAYENPVNGVWSMHYPYSNDGNALFNRTFHSIKQSTFILNNKEFLNKILRFENLQNDYKELPFINNNIELPLINPTKNDRPHWKDMHNEESIKLVNEIYKDDFELLNYEMI